MRYASTRSTSTPTSTRCVALPIQVGSRVAGRLLWHRQRGLQHCTTTPRTAPLQIACTAIVSRWANASCDGGQNGPDRPDWTATRGATVGAAAAAAGATVAVGGAAAACHI